MSTVNTMRILGVAYCALGFIYLLTGITEIYVLQQLFPLTFGEAGFSVAVYYFCSAFVYLYYWRKVSKKVFICMAVAIMFHDAIVGNADTALFLFIVIRHTSFTEVLPRFVVEMGLPLFLADIVLRLARIAMVVLAAVVIRQTWKSREPMNQ